MKFYAQFDGDGVVFSVVESANHVVGLNIVEVSDFSALGKKWNGEKIVDLVVPKKYKIWSAVAFVTICGQAVFDAIVDGNSKDLRYFKYILDKADIVDLNIPQYFAMVQLLKTRGIMSQATFDILTAQE